MKQPKPTVEHISTSKSIYGGYAITYLIDNTYETFRYHGYTKAEAEKLAKIDARKTAEQYYIQD